MRPALYVSVLFSLIAWTAFAAPITYSVNVNTSSISGISGSLDFNFNPGPLATQSASLQILAFGGDGSLSGPPMRIGDVTGALPGAVTFDNGMAFNDYFEGFTFASKLSFNVSLYGPALSSPDGVSMSGSSFAFSMFSDAAGTKPVLTSDRTNGFAYIVNVNLDGSTTVTNLIPSTAPEPGTWLLAATALALVIPLRQAIENRRKA